MYYLFFVFQNGKIIAEHSQIFFTSNTFHCIYPIISSNSLVDRLIHSYAVDSVRTLLIDKKQQQQQQQKRELKKISYHDLTRFIFTDLSVECILFICPPPPCMDTLVKKAVNQEIKKSGVIETAR